MATPSPASASSPLPASGGRRNSSPRWRTAAPSSPAAAFFADHHPYTGRRDRCAQGQAGDALLVTTEKDFVRLTAEQRAGHRGAEGRAPCSTIRPRWTACLTAPLPGGLAPGSMSQTRANSPSRAEAALWRGGGALLRLHGLVPPVSAWTRPRAWAAGSAATFFALLPPDRMARANLAAAFPEKTPRSATPSAAPCGTIWAGWWRNIRIWANSRPWARTRASATACRTG